MLHLKQRTKLCDQNKNYNITCASVFVLWFGHMPLLYRIRAQKQVFYVVYNTALSNIDTVLFAGSISVSAPYGNIICGTV